MAERIKHHIGPQHLHQVRSEKKGVEKLVQIPEGYKGPGMLIKDGLQIPVDVRAYHGLKPDDSDERGHFSVELRLGEDIKNRVEGPIPDEFLFATASDIENYLKIKLDDPQIDLSI